MPLPTSPPPVSDRFGEQGAHPAEESGGLLASILAAAVAAGASDVHLRAGVPPLVRLRGDLWPVEGASLTSEACLALVQECLVREKDWRTFEDAQECDFALDVPGIGRFRGNAYRERGSAAVVLRHVAPTVPSLEQLMLPPSLGTMAMAESGLILVAGPTGSGKSTTLAAMVAYVAERRRCHILTIEDPIEYLHSDGLATVSQREVGTDTESFASALRAGMRQDPDVICVGEIRDIATLRTALQAAETGHLVLASVHARTAGDAVNRVCDLYPADEQRLARTTLAEVLQAIVCQRLVLAREGDRRVPVLEILVTTPRIVDAIVDPDASAPIADVLAEGSHYGMRTFQDDLVRLVLEGTVSKEAAERIAPRPSDFMVALKRAGYVSGSEAKRA